MLTVMTEVCQYLRNWFCKKKTDRHVGRFTIVDGRLSLDFPELTEHVIYGQYASYYTYGNGQLETEEELPFEVKLSKMPYIRVIGSMFNDGVWKYEPGGTQGMADESFHGEVWILSIPPAVVALVTEIEDWLAQNSDVLNSPFESESFGGYSYSKRSGRSQSSSSAYSWTDQFASRLNLYRRLSDT